MNDDNEHDDKDYFTTNTYIDGYHTESKNREVCLFIYNITT